MMYQTIPANSSDTANNTMFATMPNLSTDQGSSRVIVRRRRATNAPFRASRCYSAQCRRGSSLRRVVGFGLRGLELVFLDNLEVVTSGDPGVERHVGAISRWRQGTIATDG